MKKVVYHVNSQRETHFEFQFGLNQACPQTQSYETQLFSVIKKEKSDKTVKASSGPRRGGVCKQMEDWVEKTTGCCQLDQ